MHCYTQTAPALPMVLQIMQIIFCSLARSPRATVDPAGPSAAWTNVCEQNKNLPGDSELHA